MNLVIIIPVRDHSMKRAINHDHVKVGQSCHSRKQSASGICLKNKERFRTSRNDRVDPGYEWEAATSCSLVYLVVRYTQMRISGGVAKGRRTATKRLITIASAGERLRPTSSKVREALFDILRNKLDGAVFVDLYAGTGTVGLEAVSRGAEKAVFVEPDELRFRTIIRSASEFGFLDKTRVIKGRAEEFIEKISSGQERFDIFFVDPPYHSEEIERVLPLIGESELLSEAGVVVVEHFSKKKVPETAGNLKKVKDYRYGDTMLTLYRKFVI